MQYYIQAQAFHRSDKPISSIIETPEIHLETLLDFRTCRSGGNPWAEREGLNGDDGHRRCSRRLLEDDPVIDFLIFYRA